MSTSATAMMTAAGRRPRRTRRDWVVDSLVFVVAVVFGLLIIGGRMESPTPGTPAWLFTADVVAGAVGCAGLWLRRRWPVGLALSMLAGLVYVVLRPEPGTPAWFLYVIGLVVQSAAVGWGLFIHYRRQLVLSLRDRAERAETEAQLRPSRSGSAPGTRSPARCTTSSATGCRC